MTQSKFTDITEQQKYAGILDDLQRAIDSAQATIDSAIEWTPKLQMTREGQYVAECIKYAIENGRVVK